MEGSPRPAQRGPANGQRAMRRRAARVGVRRQPSGEGPWRAVARRARVEDRTRQPLRVVAEPRNQHELRRRGGAGRRSDPPARDRRARRPSARTGRHRTRRRSARARAGRRQRGAVSAAVVGRRPRRASPGGTRPGPPSANVRAPLPARPGWARRAHVTGRTAPMVTARMVTARPGTIGPPRPVAVPMVLSAVPGVGADPRPLNLRAQAAPAAGHRPRGPVASRPRRAHPRRAARTGRRETIPGDRIGTRPFGVRTRPVRRSATTRPPQTTRDGAALPPVLPVSPPAGGRVPGRATWPMGNALAVTGPRIGRYRPCALRRRRRNRRSRTPMCDVSPRKSAPN